RAGARALAAQRGRVPCAARDACVALGVDRDRHRRLGDRASPAGRDPAPADGPRCRPPARGRARQCLVRQRRGACRRDRDSCRRSLERRGAMRVFSGQRAWLLQRVSVLLVLVLLAVGGLRLLFWPAPSYEDWRSFASSAHGAVLIVLFFGAVALHAWV